MEENKVLEWLREIVETCDNKNEAFKDMRREVDLWRERFLRGFLKGEDTKKEDYMRGCFIYAVSSHMVKDGPEKVLKCAEDYWNDTVKNKK